MEVLGFGRYFMIDGEQNQQDPLKGKEATLTLLSEIAREHFRKDFSLESFDFDDGSSFLLVLAESQLCLHYFPTSSRFSLSLFSRQDFDMSSIWQSLTSALNVGRYESSMLAKSSLYIGRSHQELAPQVAGERHYRHQRLQAL